MKLSRVAAWLCSTYFSLLLVILVYGLLKYGHLKEILPTQAMTEPPGALELYSAYGGFLDITILLLALLIGVWSALFGIVKGSFFKGMILLVAAVMLTGLAYSLLPRLYYPGGDFSSFVYWLSGGFYAYSGAWFLTTSLGLLIKRKVAAR